MLSRRSFRDEADASALPWLLGIARNVARESARRNAVETRARRRLGLPTDLASEDGYAAVEERLSPRMALTDALETLPEHEREALDLRIVDELPYADVADRLYGTLASETVAILKGAHIVRTHDVRAALDAQARYRAEAR